MKFQHGEGNANSDVNALTAVGSADDVDGNSNGDGD